MHINFDDPVERRGTDSTKWRRFGDDVLPLWIADMDFVSPPPVIEALRRRVEHGIFGYGDPPEALRLAICERLARLYGWQVPPTALMFLPGLVCGLNLVSRSIGQPGDGVLVQTPVYPPFLSAPVHGGRVIETATLVQRNGRYEVDWDAMEQAITPRTRLFLLCNPHNPVGRVYERWELERMAEICLRHDLVICSDEIHSDLVYDGRRHIPIASLAPEVAERCITLLSPSKTFNLAGLGCAFAIASNPELMKRLHQATAGLVPSVNVFGYVAALAAYQEGQPWLDALLTYLAANRDELANYVQRHLPMITMTKPEGTYLAWLDCRAIGLPGSPAHFFLQEARVALSDGAAFGPGGEGFVRLNFGCPRATLTQALTRMRDALARLG